MTELTTMTRDEAERLTERIRLTATTYMEAKERLVGLIRQAREGGAHEALGFKSWTAYAEAVCSDTPLMQLTRDQRRELVSELSDDGMSTLAIAPIVWASQKTVDRDLRAESFDSPGAEPRQIAGRDGKTYSAPSPSEPSKRKRRPVVEIVRDAGMQARDSIDKVARAIEDDRFERDGAVVREQIKNQLNYVIETAQGLLDDINKEN